MQKLISVDLKADFGFFRKPDTNSAINLSYNIIHKPALLGILGAIIGLEGYKQELGKLPVYYNALKDIKIGVEPLDHQRGNYQKTVVKYTNTVGYANNRSNLLIEEAILIKPTYRVYLLLDLDNVHQEKLFEYLKAGKAEYLPYFGKNEFAASFDGFKGDYLIESNVFDGKPYEIKTIFSKSIIVKDSVADDDDDFADMSINFILAENTFIYFENLPIELSSEKPIQYKLEPFSFTTCKMKPNVRLPNLFRIQPNQYVQLF